MNDPARRRRASPVLLLAVVGVVALLALAVWRPWTPEDDEAHGHPDLSLLVDDLRPAVSGAPASWRITLVNTGGRRTLEFASSLTIDVALVRDGVEAFRWSDSIVPTPRPRSLQVPAGRSDFSVTSDALDVTPGTYDFVVTMPSDPAPAPLRLRLEVRARRSVGEYHAPW